MNINCYIIQLKFDFILMRMSLLLELELAKLFAWAIVVSRDILHDSTFLTFPVNDNS